MSSAPSSKIPYFLLSALAVASDQFSKLSVLESFRFMERLNIVPGWQKFFFLVLAAVISLYLARAIWRDDFGRWGKIGAAMIIGGAIGNVIDRLLYGHVVDFLLFYWQDWFYPAFNIADSFICVGAVLLVVDGLKNKKPSENGNKEKQ